jgi:hypothetical protein
VSDTTDDMEIGSAMYEVWIENKWNNLQKKIWVTKDDKRIKFKDLDASHIRNIIKHLQDSEEEVDHLYIKKLNHELSKRSNQPARINKMSQELTITNDNQNMSLSAEQVAGQVQLVQQVMKAVMKDGEHYGTIPGCGTKKVLLKAGAEKLALTFKFSTQFKIDIQNFENGHREYRIITTVIHIGTGKVLGEGVGSCSTMESKYRYRNAAYKCPKCGKETIIKGKAEYGGGFICFAKKGGCGAKFADNDESILSQPLGKIDNIDIADAYNTVLKMAKKRSLVDAILTATAASDIFTQDLEETMPMEQISDKNIDKETGEVIREENKNFNIESRKKQIIEELTNQTDAGKLKNLWQIFRKEAKTFNDKDFITTLDQVKDAVKDDLVKKISNEDIQQ